MKRKMLTLAVIALMISAAATAQTVIKPHIGLNLTDVSIDASQASASGKAGALVGLSVAFGKKIYFEPGLQYVAKSTEYSSTQNPDFDKEKYSLKGLRVPVAVGINLLGNEKSLVTLHGFGGLSAFFVTGNDYEDLGIDINKAQWGVFAGAGVDIWKIFVDVSYEWSLSKLSTDIDATDIGKTRSLFVNAGIRINL